MNTRPKADVSKEYDNVLRVRGSGPYDFYKLKGAEKLLEIKPTLLGSRQMGKKPGAFGLMEMATWFIRTPHSVVAAQDFSGPPAHCLQPHTTTACRTLNRRPRED
jgi:hypothetical protein